VEDQQRLEVLLVVVSQQVREVLHVEVEVVPQAVEPSRLLWYLARLVVRGPIKEEVAEDEPHGDHESILKRMQV
jgi:hypothetical protein